MAYISAIDDEEDKQPGAELSVVPPAGQAAPAPGPVAQQSKFVNFSRYLDANRGAAQAAAQNIYHDINAQGQKVNSDLATSQNQFNQGVQAGSQTYTAGKSLDDVRTGAAKSYSGPSALSAGADWQTQQANARKAQDAANATASTGGIGALLQQQSPGAYSDGARRFDAGLTGYVGADRFADARAKYGALSDALNKANDASAKTADAARATTAEAQTKYGADKTRLETQANTQQQTADDDKLLNDVSTLIDERTSDLKTRQHKDERVAYLTKTGQLQRAVEERFGKGAWDRYMKAKQSREDARTAAIGATYPGGHV